MVISYRRLLRFHLHHTSITRSSLARSVLPRVTDLLQGRIEMLWTLFLVLIVLWMIGVVSSYTLGGVIHLLLIFAVVALLIQLISGRRVA
jgi:hypothetical protein